MKPKILVVDDHEIVREGVRRLLTRSRPEWEICGEAANGEQAVGAVEQMRPDVVILDISMPGMGGLEAAARIAKMGLGCRTLIFTMHESNRLDAEIRDIGAQGYVQKSQAARDLVLAIERVLQGENFFSPHGN
jgi:DNA-binding NarL/FixJ family response regulator